jgi:hypothetical protein
MLVSQTREKGLESCRSTSCVGMYQVCIEGFVSLRLCTIFRVIVTYISAAVPVSAPNSVGPRQRAYIQ